MSAAVLDPGFPRTRRWGSAGTLEKSAGEGSSMLGATAPGAVGAGAWLGCGEEAGRAPHPLFTPGVLRTENTPFSYSMFWGSPGKGAGQLVAELGAAGERLCWELL